MRYLTFVLALVAAPAFADCPDPNLEGPTYEATGPELIAPRDWDVRAQGDTVVPCAQWAETGVLSGDLDGYLPLAPTARFELSGLGSHILMVMARAECRPILAARTGDGLWYFGETANGREEIVLWGAGDGPMQVWVGSGDPDGCDAILTLETFDH